MQRELMRVSGCPSTCIKALPTAQEKNMFKSFSEKSKAKRGLIAFAAKLGVELQPDTIVSLLHMHGDPMKWGFEEDNVAALCESTEKESQPVADASVQVSVTETTTDTGDSEGDSEEHFTPAPAPNMFAGIGATLGAVASNPAPAATRSAPAPRTNYTIEKDRPEQNGIKRPSAGGLCRAVWDALDEQRTANNGEVPTTQQVRDLALMNNWNSNNAMIEYYQWRKYNGITGRAAKKAEEPKA
jgi:hypothetical protein